MRTILTLDDDLLAIAERYTGLKEKSALVREALRASRVFGEYSGSDSN